jgi:hypothetical protein
MSSKPTKSQRIDTASMWSVFFVIIILVFLYRVGTS